MPSTVWIKKGQRTSFQEGDVIDAQNGGNIFLGYKPRDSEEWRIVYIADASVELLTEMRLFQRLDNPATHTNILKRIRYIDIRGLEAHAERMVGRRMASDDILTTSLMTFELYVRDRLLPSIPGIIV